MNGILLWLAKFAIGKQVISALAYGHNLLDGRKSEIIVVLYGLVHALKIFGVIPAASADSVENALTPLLPLVLADRASKIKASVDKLVS